MAITITQQPTTPNLSYSNLVFVLSSDNIDEVEFSYVMEMTVGSETVTLRKQGNPTGSSVFDVSRIVNDYLDWEIDALGAASDANTVNQFKSFSFVFKEEYQGSSGDLITPNAATTPVVISVLKGVREHNEGDLTSDFTLGPVLSQYAPTIRVHRDDDLIITSYDDGFNVVTQNVIAIPASVNTSTVTVEGNTYTLDIYDTRNDLGERRFVWFNRFGGIDSFTADQEERKMSSVNKSSYSSTPITYGFSTSSNRERLNNNVFKSTSYDYRIDYDTTYAKNTKWLDEDEAKLLEGIFDSPRVYLQEGDLFTPVTILNSSYDSLTYLRAEELFQYEIMWRPTNDKRRI